MAERQAILSFGQERLRTGDSGHRISNSGPATSNLPPRETGGPIRGLDALGAAIGAIRNFAAGPDVEILTFPEQQTSALSQQKTPGCFVVILGQTKMISTPFLHLKCAKMTETSHEHTAPEMGPRP